MLTCRAVPRHVSRHSILDATDKLWQKFPGRWDAIGLGWLGLVCAEWVELMLDPLMQGHSL